MLGRQAFSFGDSALFFKAMLVLGRVVRDFLAVDGIFAILQHLGDVVTRVLVIKYWDGKTTAHARSSGWLDF